jgi:hypothetical protein
VNSWIAPQPGKPWRRGKPIAQITRVQALRKPIDFAALKALTDRLPMQKVSAGNFVRKMRDKERY